jgi:RHS repeat-associated protein
MNCMVMTVWRSYDFQGATPIALRVQVNGVGDLVYYLLTDHLGSITVSYRSDGKETRFQSFKPWSELRKGGNSLQIDRTYTSQRWSASIGLWFICASSALLDDFGGGSLGGSSFSGILDPKEPPKEPLISVSEWLKTHKGEQGSRKDMARQMKLKNPSFIFIPLEVTAGKVITITYGYDDLYRLTAADYSDGSYYHYSYDSVGNRLTEQTQAGSTNYVYDVANRLTNVNGVSYTWDNNGNLLNDGTNTYSYNHANRLIAASGPGYTSSYSYNGQGDRIRETVDSVTTNYTLDLVSGLTQVLADGTETYLYGSRCIAQYGATTDYFLGDALGSVRQLINSNGEVTLAKSYQPYGSTQNSEGEANTSYGFTSEREDSYTQFVYLRARWYAPQTGRFITKDSWLGDFYRPVSQNKWNYAYSNPVVFTDPTGEDPLGTCLTLLATLAVVDGPIPAGDVAGVISCLAIFGGATIAAAIAAQNAPEVAHEVEKACNWNWLLTRPVRPSLLEQPTPEPNPKPKIQPIPIPKPPKVTETPEVKVILYHYTTQSGAAGIVASQFINPSTDERHAIYGPGQYFTDISPVEAATGSANQLSRAIYKSPLYTTRVSNYVAVNVSGLP